ncbi:uncharacterized protein JCM10292_007279 [Rhodotorula paludigena]|uniref:uncharacterized protein n=1 Tax=Rhodotorula paludigena TaxID=86838 RepID=UPI00316DE733
MAPLKLPKKGKSKQLHLDFRSLDAARASAPPDWDSEAWLEEGTKQEEQGERYQVGAKAARHLSNAAVCYRLAAALAPADFDSRYNGARVQQTLATEHLPSPACLSALDDARTAYRDALSVLQPGAKGEATARIDALFNLAQTDVALFEMLDDAIVALGQEADRALQVAKEARALFVEVERLQRAEMARFFGETGPEADAGGDEAADEAEPPGGSAAGETSVRALEVTIVTPQLLIDTLLESVSFDLTLYNSSYTDAATEAELRQSALDSFTRATALRPLVPGAAPELDFELAFVQATLYTTLSPDEAPLHLEQLISSTAPVKVDLLSLYADHQVETLPLTAQLPAILSSLSTALKTYESAQALLSNRLSPPKHLPASHLPSLLSSNLVAQSTVHLLAYEVLSRAQRDPSLAPTLPADAAAQTAEHLSRAHALALEATSAPRLGLSLVLSASAAASSGTSAPPPLALARAPASQEPRTDWRTVASVRLALFSLARVRMRMLPPASAAGGKREEQVRFWAFWRALGLARGEGTEKGSEGGRALERREVRWWIGEIAEDKVQELMGAEEAATERAYWEELAEL